MEKSYNLLLNGEPTDEQLHGLMQEVLKDVKERAALAAQRFEAFQVQQAKEAIELSKQYMERYGKK